MSFTICTDSTANLPAYLIEKFGIEVASLDYIDSNGEVHKSYEAGKETELKPFYDKLREKQSFTTACLNEYAFVEFFEPILSKGNDLIYIGFSSGLSATYESSVKAVEILKQKYPDRVIYSVDSLCASMGLGLLVYNACLLKEEGKSIHDLNYIVERDKHKICHLFTVDDLYYLYKGGRLSPTSYFIANLINIKPVLRCDEQGKLCAYGKVIGRKKALNSLIAKLCETIVNPEQQTLFVSHGDCQEDADYVAQKIREKLPVKDVIVGYIDSVIGAHSGPGTLAIFYMANDRSV